MTMIDLTPSLMKGTTEKGVKCHAYITRIACHRDLDNSEFERELHEHI